MSFRRSRIRTERWQNAVFEQLAEIKLLRGKLFHAETELETYLNDPDEPERRAEFDRFLAAGGEKANEWRAWLKNEWPPRPKIKRRRRRPRIVWVNPNLPTQE